MDVADVGRALRAEARAVDERRLVVLAGDRGAGYEALGALLGVGFEAATLVGPEPPEGASAAVRADVERLAQHRADRLLGTTRDLVALDAHRGLRPNALGRVVGAVDGGGLLVVLAPPLADWPDDRDEFDETLAVPPYGVEDVAGRFRTRLVETILAHPGIAVLDVDAGRVVRDGRTDPAPRPSRGRTREGGDAPARGGEEGDAPAWTRERADARARGREGADARARGREGADARAVPGTRAFPAAAYEACLTDDQVGAVAALERLGEPGHAVVVEADRGRGKSAAAGIAAGALAAAGRDVLVTAPEYRGAVEVFVRAESLLGELDALAERDVPAAGDDADTPAEGDDADAPAEEDDADTPAEGDDADTPTERGDDADAPAERGDADAPRRIDAEGGGVVRFVPPVAAAELPGGPDAVVVDEAAALPVRLLSSFLAAPSVAFTTTVHGYEGAGRGFSVRFRDRLAESDLDVREVGMVEPIRYAPGDPVEVWAFRALLLDASPAADQLVADARAETVEYRALSPEALLADEHRLREAFGLLVLAHYRTEPDDLARLLDAPNLSVRGLVEDGHVASVALLAEEGDLPADLRAEMYEGARVPGNMLPDVLTSQLRDEAAGECSGLRVMRIATHPAVRRRGLGSRLLGEVRAEHADRDWLGAGFGATPELVEFWAGNGYRTVHLSTTRNDESGEYSALVLDPLSDAGRALAERHGRWFVRRVRDQLPDALDDADPDVVRAALRATDPGAVRGARRPADEDARTDDDAPASDDGPVPDLDLDAREWRVVADAAFGPGLYDAAPGAFRSLAVAHLVDPADPDLLDARQERLLVLKVLQARPWTAVADRLGYHSRGEAMRALGAAFQPLVDAYGDATAREFADRFR